MTEKFPGEENELTPEQKDQQPEQTEGKGNTDNETGKDLDALNASVLLSKEEADRQNAEKQERQESKEDIDALHYQVERNSQSTDHKSQSNKERPSIVNYEEMTEEEIENRADEGRKESVATVQNMVNTSSVIPGRLKKLTN